MHTFHLGNSFYDDLDLLNFKDFLPLAPPWVRGEKRYAQKSLDAALGPVLFCVQVMKRRVQL